MKKIGILLLLVFAVSGLFAQTEAQSENQHFDPALFPDGVTSITIYVREDCGRCHDMTQAFDDAGISYKKVEMGSEAVQQELDKKIYNALPVKGMGYSVRFPVVELNDVLYFRLANHHEFTLQFIEYMQKDE